MFETDTAMTRRRAQVLEFLRSYIGKFGYPPSTREIMDGCGFASTSTVIFHLRELEREGLIERVRGRSRAIRLIGKGGNE